MLALFIFTILSLLIAFGIIGVLASPSKPDIGSKGVLVLDLSNIFNEQRQQNPIGSITGDASSDVPGLYDVVRILHFAKSDSSIKGLFIKAENNPNGYASSEELIKAVEDFKESGKTVIAYGEAISQKAYYVASAANKIYCHPAGGLEWNGLSVDLYFVKNLLDRLEIQPQIFYAGKFKSATEPFRATQMTEPNKLQTNVWLSDLYSLFLQQTSRARNIDTAQLHNLANTGAIQTANDALKYHLVDGLKYDNDIKTEWLRELHLGKKDKINFITLGKYSDAVDYAKTSGDNRIAVLYAQGDIVGGTGQKGQIASDDYKNLIRKLRLDDEVKAIVFRVNSPGGSALASDVIWHEIQLARKVKPVVVSMGDYAASGGYYISCAADSIYADAGTITGSIGVFTVIPNMSSFFKDKLGVTFDGVKTAPYADMMTVSRPLTATEQHFVQANIDTTYNTFLSRVATGRKKDTASIDSIAQGRVWTGTHGIPVGIVDRIGTLHDAIVCAARMIKTNDYYVKEYPEKKSYLQELLDTYSNKSMKQNAVEEQVGKPTYDMLMKLKSVQNMFNVPQARLPFMMDVK